MCCGGGGGGCATCKSKQSSPRNFVAWEKEKEGKKINSCTMLFSMFGRKGENLP